MKCYEKNSVKKVWGKICIAFLSSVVCVCVGSAQILAGRVIKISKQDMLGLTEEILIMHMRSMGLDVPKPMNSGTWGTGRSRASATQQEMEEYLELVSPRVSNFYRRAISVETLRERMKQMNLKIPD